MYGQHKIPLLYITREADVGDSEEIYDDRRNKLTMCVSHIGAAYKADNGDVLSILVQNIENSEGSSIVQLIERRRNGCKAWQELVRHFEGDTYKQRCAQEADTILKTAIYTGPKKNFTFGDYYKLHTSARTKFFRASKHMTPEQKTDSFVQGIECSTAQSIVVSISGDPLIRITFEAYYNAIASRIELANSLTQKGNLRREDRLVNQGKSERNKKYQGKNTAHKRNSYPKRDTSQNKSYTSAEWKALTKEQQNAVKRHNAGKKAQASANATGSQTPPNLTQNGHPPQQITNYVPPPPVYPRSVSQFALTPTYIPSYGYHDYHNRNVSQLTLPPQPGTAMIPPPPPTPCSQTPHIASNAHTGNVGQYFGTFGPAPPQM